MLSTSLSRSRLNSSLATVRTLTVPTHIHFNSARNFVCINVGPKLASQVRTTTSSWTRARIIAWSQEGSMEGEKRLNFKTVITALAKAAIAWEMCDKDRNGKMSLQECEKIFNSEELSEAVKLLTGFPPPAEYTAKELEPFFKRADKDTSSTLNFMEFLALYLAVTLERIDKDPLLLTHPLLHFLDKDRNGEIQCGELKPILRILGVPSKILNFMPDSAPFPTRIIVGILEFLGRFLQWLVMMGERARLLRQPRNVIPAMAVVAVVAVAVKMALGGAAPFAPAIATA